MKKFVLITIGFTQPTPEIMQSWMQWFKSIEDKIADQLGSVMERKWQKTALQNCLWIKML